MKTVLKFIFVFAVAFSLAFNIMNAKSIMINLSGKMQASANTVSGEATVVSAERPKVQQGEFVLFDNSQTIKQSNQYRDFPGKQMLLALNDSLKELSSEDIKAANDSSKARVEATNLNFRHTDTPDMLSVQGNDEDAKKFDGKNWISIDSLGIHAPISEVDIEAKDLEGTILKELQKGVVRRPETQRPFEQGNFFLIGHSSNYAWIRSEFNDVFAKVDSMPIGDVAKVYYDGRVYEYQLYEKKIVSPDQIDVYNYISGYNMTLMTCYPVGTDKKRLIAKFRLLKPEIER